jgi:hypothetical protein
VCVPNVSYVSDVRCKYFHLHVVKLDLNVIYICILQAYFSSFIFVFHTSVASVSCGCCICLQWFLSVFHVFSVSVSDACFKCSICLLYMLQLSNLHISKVDRSCT